MAVRDDAPLRRRTDKLQKQMPMRGAFALLRMTRFCGYAGSARTAPQLNPAPKAARTMGVAGGAGFAARHSEAAMSNEAEDVLP